ncbi:MAG: hypothetical protein U5K84_10625 [Alkalibacterium sp.]|nr:hypothetical protein [Alkalibacterium sp.]
MLYCIEEKDNGRDLHLFDLMDVPKPKSFKDPVLGEITALEGKSGKACDRRRVVRTVVYGKRCRSKRLSRTSLTFIPYHLWANRSAGEMRVWIDRK